MDWPLMRILRMIAAPSCDSCDLLRIASAGLPMSGILMSSARAIAVVSRVAAASSAKVRLRVTMIIGRRSKEWPKTVKTGSVSCGSTS